MAGDEGSPSRPSLRAGLAEDKESARSVALPGGHRSRSSSSFSSLVASGRSNFVPAMGNFSVQYNFTSASMAVTILGSDKYLGYPLEKEPAWSSDMTIPIVFLGAMIGMLVMGRLGDVLGRSRAMQVTLSLSVLGAAIPAVAAGPASVFYLIVCFGRLVLGVGVGGIYPLSAVSSAEGTGGHENKGAHVGKAFLWQSIGCVATYAVAMLMLGSMKPPRPEKWVPEIQFRLLFALGIIPTLIVLVVNFWTEDSTEFRTHRHTETVWAAFQNAPAGTRWTLAGTAGTWFIYDVAYYGTSIFTPTILEAICLTGNKVHGKCEQSLYDTALQSAIVASMGIPGCLLSIAIIGRIGCKRLNAYGFILLAACFSLMAIVWTAAPQRHGMLFGIFCILTGLLNFGPNLGTYVLPAICFPAHMRSTCHGLSATGGKLGALLGAVLFAPVSDGPLGVTGVLWIQAATCLVGALVAQVFLKHDWEYSPDAESEGLARSLPHDAGALCHERP